MRLVSVFALCGLLFSVPFLLVREIFPMALFSGGGLPLLLAYLVGHRWLSGAWRKPSVLSQVLMVASFPVAVWGVFVPVHVWWFRFVARGKEGVLFEDASIESDYVGLAAVVLASALIVGLAVWLDAGGWQWGKLISGAGLTLILIASCFVLTPLLTGHPGTWDAGVILVVWVTSLAALAGGLSLAQSKQRKTAGE